MGQLTKVAVFDSGVGGLSILGALLKVPGLELAYGMDNAHFPYGTKSDADVLKYVLQSVQRFVHEWPCDIFVIACNTASTVALDEVRKILTCPVVGVVPAIKPAAALSQTKVIGLLATQVAVRQQYIDRLMAEHGGGCQLVRSGSGRLVELAEAKLRNLPPALEVVAEEIAPLFTTIGGGPVDTIVLGCTHFPLLKDEMQKVSPWPVRFVDSGEAVARRVVHLVEGMGRGGVSLTTESRVVHVFYTDPASVDPALDHRIQHYGNM